MSKRNGGPTAENKREEQMLLFKMNSIIYLLMLPYHHVLGLVLVSYLSGPTSNANLFL